MDAGGVEGRAPEVRLDEALDVARCEEPEVLRERVPVVAVARVPAPRAVAPSNAEPSPLCDYFLKGECRYGALCRKLHVDIKGGRKRKLTEEEIAQIKAQWRARQEQEASAQLAQAPAPRAAPAAAVAAAAPTKTITRTKFNSNAKMWMPSGFTQEPATKTKQHAPAMAPPPRAVARRSHRARSASYVRHTSSMSFIRASSFVRYPR